MADVTKLRIENTEYDIIDEAARQASIESRTIATRNRTQILNRYIQMDEKTRAIQANLERYQNRINNIVITEGKLMPISVTSPNGQIAIYDTTNWTNTIADIMQNDENSFFGTENIYFRPRQTLLDENIGRIRIEQMDITFGNVQNPEFFTNNFETTIQFSDDYEDIQFHEDDLNYVSFDPVAKTATYRILAQELQADTYFDPTLYAVACLRTIYLIKNINTSNRQVIIKYGI